MGSECNAEKRCPSRSAQVDPPARTGGSARSVGVTGAFGRDPYFRAERTVKFLTKNVALRRARPRRRRRRIAGETRPRARQSSGETFAACRCSTAARNGPGRSADARQDRRFARELASIWRPSYGGHPMEESLLACKSCRRELAGEQGRQVADWIFCEACFAALLDPPRSAPPAPAPLLEPISDGALRAPDQPRCSLCGGSVAAGEGMDVGPVRLCVGCSILARSLEEQPEPVKPRDDVGDQGSGPEVACEAVNWALTACAGCGRRIPERGSKGPEGGRYCPDCFHALPVPPVSAAPAQASPVHEPAVQQPAHEASPSLSPAAAPVECDGCGRAVNSGGADLVQGFRICPACRATDEALALELARERHRRRLAALKLQLRD